MPVKAYGDAISTLAIAYSQVPESKNAELAHYMIRMAINALTDCINEELGFKEPERPICDCDKNPGPKLGEEDEYYRRRPLQQDTDCLRFEP